MSSSQVTEGPNPTKGRARLTHLQRLEAEEFEDLVAELGGLLELQVFGRLFHLHFQVFDHSIHVGAGHFFAHYVVTRPALRNGLDPLGNVMDLFLDALGLDAVLFVERVLNAPAAVGFIYGLPIESVIRSAYMMTCPLECRAARPMV